MKIIFDSKSLLKFFKGEPNADKVKSALRTIEENENQGYLSAVSLTEIYYVIHREDPAKAEEYIRYLMNSALKIVPLVSSIAIEAGKIKSMEAIPIADSIIAATAKVGEIKRVFTDDEHFKMVEGISCITQIDKKSN